MSYSQRGSATVPNGWLRAEGRGKIACAKNQSERESGTCGQLKEHSRKVTVWRDSVSPGDETGEQTRMGSWQGPPGPL